jgi:hypothetical protein
VHAYDRRTHALAAVIDGGCTYTDGLDVTSAYCGPLYPNGFLVLHDDVGPNFEVFAWDEIADAGGLLKNEGTTSIRMETGLQSGGDGLSVFPNPFSTSIRIKCLMPNSEFGMGNIFVDVYDISGKKVTRLNSLRIPQSAFGIEQTWDASGQPGGMYLIRTQIGKSVMLKRVTLMK